jgi:hypothetical protein
MKRVDRSTKKCRNPPELEKTQTMIAPSSGPSKRSREGGPVVFDEVYIETRRDREKNEKRREEMTNVERGGPTCWCLTMTMMFDDGVIKGLSKKPI